MPSSEIRSDPCSYDHRGGCHECPKPPTVGRCRAWCTSSVESRFGSKDLYPCTRHGKDAEITGLYLCGQHTAKYQGMLKRWMIEMQGALMRVLNDPTPVDLDKYYGDTWSPLYGLASPKVFAVLSSKRTTTSDRFLRILFRKFSHPVLHRLAMGPFTNEDKVYQSVVTSFLELSSQNHSDPLEEYAQLVKTFPSVELIPGVREAGWFLYEEMQGSSSSDEGDEGLWSSDDESDGGENRDSLTPVGGVPPAPPLEASALGKPPRWSKAKTRQYESETTEELERVSCDPSSSLSCGECAYPYRGDARCDAVCMSTLGRCNREGTPVGQSNRYSQPGFFLCRQHEAQHGDALKALLQLPGVHEGLVLMNMLSEDAFVEVDTELWEDVFQHEVAFHLSTPSTMLQLSAMQRPRDGVSPVRLNIELPKRLRQYVHSFGVLLNEREVERYQSDTSFRERVDKEFKYTIRKFVSLPTVARIKKGREFLKNHLHPQFLPERPSRPTKSYMSRMKEYFRM